MVKKAAAQAPAPVPVEDDLPPTSSDDEEKAAQPAAAHKKKDETHLPQPSRLPAPQQQESETAPLLGSVSAPASDEPERPKTPREKFREKSQLTPRDTAEPPAAEPMAEVHAFKDAALKEFGNAHIPTKEELLGSVDSVKQQAAEAQARAKKLYEDMIADAPPPLTKLPDAKRMEAYIDELAQQAETMTPRAPGIVNALKPCLLTTIRIGMALHPWFTFLMKYAFVLWELLPKNLLLMLFGAALCYFGGAYTASIAAIEAFRTMGWERAYTDFAHLKRQAEKVQQQSEKDDEIDDDGDGVPDVAQISSAELVRRKFYLTLETIDEPHRIQSAIANVWAACLAVLATLRIQFAATTAMALGTHRHTAKDCKHSTAAAAKTRASLLTHTSTLSTLAPQESST